MNNWIILLTTAVTNFNNTMQYSDYRKQLYNYQILQWLKRTNYKIVVVESSGYDFPDIIDERLHKVSFKFNTGLPSSSQYEAQSILNALNDIKNTDFYNNCTHILKVTGRYFLDNVEQHLNRQPQDKDLYLQKHRNDSSKWQHCEYFGIRKELFPIFLNSVKDIGLMENRLWDFSVNNKSYCHIGYFSNNIRRGGDHLLIKNL
jgi:hypothetical protein